MRNLYESKLLFIYNKSIPNFGIDKICHIFCNICEFGYNINVLVNNKYDNEKIY